MKALRHPTRTYVHACVHGLHEKTHEVTCATELPIGRGDEPTRLSHLKVRPRLFSMFDGNKTGSDRSQASTSSLILTETRFQGCRLPGRGIADNGRLTSQSKNSCPKAPSIVMRFLGSHCNNCMARSIPSSPNVATTPLSRTGFTIL